MNTVEHQATVDKGLKMKIKRKNVAGSPSAGSKTDAAKHEMMKGDVKGVLTSGSPQAPVGGGANAEGSASVGGATSTLDKLKQTLTEKERINSKQPVSGLVRNMHKRTIGHGKDRKDNAQNHANSSFVMALLANGSTNNGPTPTLSSGNVSSVNNPPLASNNVMVELNRISNTLNIKKEAQPDPYEFNAKVEDRIGLPVKKVKLEKMENSTSPGVTSTHTDMDTKPAQRDVGTETSNVAVATDPDCLGPCEPGTSVVLEGIVWNETENGILVVNVTWRGKTYVGTLMDATKHAWAPPRLNCDSPANDDGARTPRGRGKRGRNTVTPPVVDLGERRLRKRRTNNNNPYAAPPSPAKSEMTNSKKRGRPADLDLDLDNVRSSKRARTSKNGGQNCASNTIPENGFIACPEPNCMKKYRHMNGLKYHQAHAHKNYEDTEDGSDDKMDYKSHSDEKDVPSSPNGKGRAGRKTSSSQGDHSSTANSGDSKSDGSPSAGGKSKKSATKEEKTDNKENKKQLDKQPTVALTPISLDSNKSGANMFTSSTISSLSSITTVSVLPSTASAQNTTTTASTAMSISATEKPKKVKGEKGDKKGKHRPIIPAQNSLPVSAAHSQISIAASPIQTGSGLKPIQPKPTILGDTATVNPLVGLKEKKAKKKKNKDKDKEREKPKSSDHKSSKDTKSDSIIVASEPSVTLTMGLGGSKPLEALAKMSTNPPELQKQGTSQQGSLVEKTTASPPDLQKQPPALAKVNSPLKVVDAVSTRPPSSLSVNSPVMNSNNTEGKDSSNTNAQSPAYSDISDANDSSSTLYADSVEVKKEPQSTAEPAKGQPNDRPSSQGYPGGVYGGYYPPQSFHSPNTGSPQTNKDTPKVPAQMSKNLDKSGKSSESTSVKTERKDEGKDQENGPKSNPSPAQMRDYQERMMHAQQMAQYQQYMGAYGYGVDMRSMANNPEYKAQYEWMMEQERARRDYMEKMAKGSDSKIKMADLSRPLDLNTKAIDLSKQGKASPTGKSSTVTSNDIRNKSTEGEHFKNKDGASFTPGEYRKDKMVDGQKDGEGKLESRGPAYPPGYERQQEEYRRYFMFQQQRLLEQKRYVEQHQGKPQLTRDHPGQQSPHQPSPHSQSPHGQHPHSQSPQVQPPHGREHLLGREPHQRDPQTPHTRDSSASRDSQGSRDQSGSRSENQSPYNKNHPHHRDNDSRPNSGHPHHDSRTNSGYAHHDSRSNSEFKSDKLDKSKPGARPTNSHPGSPAAKPGDQRDSQPSTPNSYGQFYPQGYPGYTSQVPYDPSHSMYQQNPVLGYATSPNNYPPYVSGHMRGSFVDGHKDSKVGMPSPGGKSSQEGKALELLQQKAASYYNSHSPQAPLAKVKDMKEVTRGAMPSPVKDVDRPESCGSAASSGKDKDRKSPPTQRKSPPTQRHVHTHHHTHLVGPAYSLYGPYGGTSVVPSQPPPAAAAPYGTAK